MATEKLTNNASSTLNGGILAGAGSLTVNNAATFPTAGNFHILIDGEIFIVTDVAGNVFTVTGGQEGTATASHLNSATVTLIITAESLSRLIVDAGALALCEGRLTLTSGTPVTTADVTGATTIYFTPYKGNRIALWNGSRYVIDQFSEITIAVGTLTSGLPYDLFAFDNAGAVAFDAPVAWTNGTTRATTLTWNNGSLVKTGDATRRYIGTFYTTSTTTTEDSALNRFLFNNVNRVKRFLKVTDATLNWTYNGNGVWRQAHATAANRVQGVIGWNDALLDLSGFTLGGGNAGLGFNIGIGEDSTTAAAANCIGLIGVAEANPKSTSCRYVNTPAVGYHAWNWLENTDNGVVTFYGTRAAGSGNSAILSGLVGFLEG